MKRLTIRNSDGSVSQPTDLKWADALERLAAYEDCGLTPEELDDFARQACEIRMAAGCKTLDDCWKMVAEGRLLILPCKVGDKAFWVPDMKKKDWILEDTVYGFIVEGDNRIRLLLPELCMEPIYPQTHLFLTREEAEAALNGGADG